MQQTAQTDVNRQSSPRNDARETSAPIFRHHVGETQYESRLCTTVLLLFTINMRRRPVRLVLRPALGDRPTVLQRSGHQHVCPGHLQQTAPRCHHFSRSEYCCSLRRAYVICYYRDRATSWGVLPLPSCDVSASQCSAQTLLTGGAPSSSAMPALSNVIERRRNSHEM